MSKKEKLIKRLLSKPKDFEFNEAKTLMGLCGYLMSNAGKTSGSRIRFTQSDKVFIYINHILKKSCMNIK